MLSWLESLRESVPRDLAPDAARQLGISEQAAAAGISLLVPVVLGVLAQRAGFAPDARRLFQDVQSLPNGQGGAGARGNEFAAQLFGEREGELAESLANAIGVPSGAGAALLAMATPAVLQAVKRVANEDGISGPPGLAERLLAERRELQRVLDRRLIGALGASSPNSFLAQAPLEPGYASVAAGGPLPAPQFRVQSEPSLLVRLLPWLVVALALLLISPLVRGLAV